MIQGNYERIVGKIAGASGLTNDEVERRIEAKRAKLSGLISKEGAAQIIASELGVSFDNEKLKIEELLPGMKKVNVVGKVINLFPVRTFVRSGKENKVANLFIADETSNIKVVLWDANHIELIEKGAVKEQSIIEVSNASVRDNEIHLGSFSELKLSNEVLENVRTEKIVKENNIKNFRISENVKTRAFVVQIFDLKLFEVCPECKKRLTRNEEGVFCVEHGKITPEKRALLNLVLDDGTETIRGVVFHDSLSELGLGEKELGDLDSFANKKQELLGKEMHFSGTVKQNKFFNNLEFVIEKINEIDVNKLLEELEA